MHNGYKSGSQEKRDGEKGMSEISYIYIYMTLSGWHFIVGFL